MSQEYYDTRNGGYRILTGKVDDSGATDGNIQYVDVSGREGEEFTRVLRVQGHGFTSHPPKDSHALVIPIGNKSDVLLIVGAEHLDHRPKNIGDGNAMAYNATKGTTIHLKGDKIIINSPGDMEITSGGTLTIKASKIELKAGEIALNGGTHLGGGFGSGILASKKGTIDTGGYADITDLATKVYVT